MDSRFDALIAGYGPVGQVAANLLGQAGLRVAVFEVATHVYNLPRAAHFDAEIMRVFQSVGLTDAIAPAVVPVKGMHFVTGERQKLFGFDVADRPTVHGWPAGFMFYQPDLEKALQAGVTRFPNVELYAGHEVLAIEQDADGVTVTARDLATGETRTATGDYLWGCDGARSLARKTIGAELEGLAFDQPWLVIDTITRREVDLPDIVLQICDPARPTTFIPSAGRHRRWEFMLMPGETPAQMERPDNVWRLLGDWVTPDDVEVIRAVVYSFHALIARQWRDRRVFLLGDAAHQMPPFLGQGMCAGIRDAANLAWRLGMVRSGAASDAMFDSYQEERAPHVRTIIERAVNAGRIIQTTDREVAARRDAMFLSQGASVLVGEGAPEGRMPGLWEGLFGPRTSGAVGEVFPQVRVRDAEGRERLLDDVLGLRWAVVGTADTLTPAAARAWEELGAAVVTVGGDVSECEGSFLADWLAANRTAVVRPDRYVYGVAREAGELRRLAEGLRAQLTRGSTVASGPAQ